MKRALLAIPALVLAGCVTDPATRIAADIESAAGSLGRADGSRHTLTHRAPSKSGQCDGPYKVQIDAVGAIIVWCKDKAGTQVVSSHTTTAHGRYARIAKTVILEKGAGEALVIDFERRGGQAVIADAR